MDPTTPAPAPAGSSPSTPKLRLMCSYGGHIVPRPMDKTLCYAGGQTRIVALDRRNAFSLSTLSAHISKSLLDGRPFCLKYQLPDHDLDSLISITTDEDLSNMIDEYDRLLSSGSNTRLRFFLFTTLYGGVGNGNGGGSVGGGGELHGPTSEDWFIDALRNCGVGGKGDVGGEGGGGGGGGNLGACLAESIVLEKTSSFGSTGSSTSNTISPVVRSGGGEEGGGGGGGGGGGVKLHDVNVLPTLDSIGSDCSLPSPKLSPQNIVFQDASGFVDSKPVYVTHVETESNCSDRLPRNDLLTSVSVPSYIITKAMDQHLQPAPPPQTQYYHPTSQSHYVTQYYTNHVPVASYPTMYPQYVQPQQPAQYQINKQYPVYMMPYGQTQNPYDNSTQCTMASVATPPSVAKDPQVPSSPILVYDGYKPAISTPDYAAKVYRTPVVMTQPSSVPSDDHLHQQVVGYPPVSLPSQPVAVSLAETTKCISDYEDPMHAQIYKTQPPGPTLPSHLQIAANAKKVNIV